jgi:hypothetical protein
MNDTTKQLITPALQSIFRRLVVTGLGIFNTYIAIKPDEALITQTVDLLVSLAIVVLIESWSWISKKQLLSTAPAGAVIVPKDAVASIAASNADLSASRIGPTNTLPAILLALMMIPAGAVAVAVGGCAGQQAREEVGVPATLKAVDSIVSDASLGIDTLPVEDRDNAQIDLDAFAEAIRSGDLVTIQADAYPRWPVVHSLIKAGIESRLDAKTLGPAGASIRLNRAASYGDVLESFVWSPLGQ